MTRRAKPPFPINIIWNVKAFYVAFIFVMIASLAAVGLAPGIGSTGGQHSGGAPVDDDEPLPVETPAAVETFGDGPLPVIDASKGHEAVIPTDQGEIVIALNPDAPEAANSFAFLAGENFYDGLEFVWVSLSDNDRGSYAQAGDPTCESSAESTCTGTGGPGYTLPKEGDSTEAGQWTVIAPVTTPGGEVHGSLFGIAITDGLQFEGSIIGRVVEGQEILESLQGRMPCFRGEPSDSNPCQTEDGLPEPLTIMDVIVQPA